MAKGKRSSDTPPAQGGVKSNKYESYAVSIEQSDSKQVVRQGAIAVAIAAAFIIASEVIPLPNNFIAAAVAFPASLVLFAFASAALRRYHYVKGTLPFRFRYSAPTRRRYALFAAVGAALLFLALPATFPYGLGGTLLLLVVMGLLNFLRTTPEEDAYEEEGIIDPRDLAEEEVAPDIIGDDFQWAGGVDDEDDAPWNDEQER